MLSKKFALGFGIAILFPMLIHYGVSTFSPAPNWKDYMVLPPSPKSSPEDFAKARQESRKKMQELEDSSKRFSKHLFAVTTPIGIITIIVGSLIGVQAVGTGLMFGGIFTLLDGYFYYWSELENWMRFSSLLIAVVVLIIVGYRKMSS